MDRNFVNTGHEYHNFWTSKGARRASKWLKRKTSKFNRRRIKDHIKDQIISYQEEQG